MTSERHLFLREAGELSFGPGAHSLVCHSEAPALPEIRGPDGQRLAVTNHVHIV